MSDANPQTATPSPNGSPGKTLEALNSERVPLAMRRAQRSAIARVRLRCGGSSSWITSYGRPVAAHG